MKLLKWLRIKLGQSRHDYKLVKSPNWFRCSKCGDEMYIPEWSEFQFQLTLFKGCKK